jgi:hypothetical protein
MWCLTSMSTWCRDIWILDDAAPERPLLWTPSEVPVDQYAEQYQQLREARDQLQD